MAKVGVPSFVVTLAGLLIWQGVILKVLQVRGVIIIEEDWINKTATYYFSARNSWIIATVLTVGYALMVLGGAFAKRRAGLVIRPVITSRRSRSRDRGFRHRRDLHHATRPKACPEGTPLTVTCTQPLGLPLAAAPHARLPRRADLSREAHDVRAPRLRGRRQRGGGEARRHQRRARPDPRLRDLGDHGRRRRDRPRRAAPVGEPATSAAARSCSTRSRLPSSAASASSAAAARSAAPSSARSSSRRSRTA